MLVAVDRRERIDGFDANGKLVDVHRWDPRAHHRATELAAVRAEVIGDMAENSGVVVARVLAADGSWLDVDEDTVQQCREFHNGEA